MFICDKLLQRVHPSVVAVCSITTAKTHQNKSSIQMKTVECSFHMDLFINCIYFSFWNFM